MKKYCPTCGKGNPISAKYCCHCGDGMSLTSKVKQKPISSVAAARTQTSMVIEDVGDEEEPHGTHITASKLDVEIMSTPQTSETLGSLIQEGEQTGPVMSDGYKKGGGPKIDEKKFLEEFRREAGSIKGNQSSAKEK